MGFSGCILGSIFPQYVTFSAAMEHQKALLWCLPSVSSASPATSTPLALKGEDIPTTRSPPWPKTVGAKGSGFPSLHLDASGPRGTVGTPPAAEEILAPSSAFQTSPGELCTEDQNLLYPISSGVQPKAQPKPCFRGGCQEALHGDPLLVTSEQISLLQSCKHSVEGPYRSSYCLGKNTGPASCGQICHSILCSHFAPNPLNRPGQGWGREHQN